MDMRASLSTGLGIVAIALLGVNAYQLSRVERTVIDQAAQIESLGEATERLAGQFERLSQGGIQADNQGTDAEMPYPNVKLLHPEVPNLLEPPDDIVPEGAPTDGVIVRDWSTGDPKGFNPLIENSAYLNDLIEAYVGISVAKRKIYSDPDKWTGSAAWRVEVTDDFKEFTIYLRQDLYWHEPSGIRLNDSKYAWLEGKHQLTAHDFVFFYDAVRDPKVECGALRNYFQDVESAKALDDFTLVVRWKEKLYGNVSTTLSSAPLPRFVYRYNEDGSEIPSETFGTKFNQHWYNNKGQVGAGPYRMKEYKPGRLIVLERVDNHPLIRPAIKEIRYVIFTDPAQTPTKLKAGELDSGTLQPGQYREEILRWQGKPRSEWPKNSPFLNGDLQCPKVDTPAYSYIGWNSNRPLFADAKVRTALTLAFNREAIVKEVYVGLGRVAVGPYLPSSPFHDPNIEPLPFDLERAKQLLGEAGWTDSDGDGLLDKEINGKRMPFEFKLMIGSYPTVKALANIFQNDLLTIGIKMTPDSAEWSLMQKRMESREFDAFVAGWALTWETDPYQIWHSSQADTPRGSNMVGFKNAEVDQLIETLRETFDKDKRTEMLRRIHQIIHEQQPYSFFKTGQAVECLAKKLKNTKFSPVRPVVNTLPWWVDQ